MRGDGQTYAFGLRDMNSRYDYRYRFETEVIEGDTWQTVYISFEELVATYFGQEYANAAPFDPSITRGMNLIISDKQEGAFRLEIGEMALYREEAPAEFF